MKNKITMGEAHSIVLGITCAVIAIAVCVGADSIVVESDEPTPDVPTPDALTPDLRNVGWQRVESPRVDVECFSAGSTIVCLSEAP